MIFWSLNQLKKIITALNSGDSPAQLAGGFAIGFLIGLPPANWLYSSVVMIFLFMLNVNTSFGFLAILFVSLLGYLIDPIAHQIGLYLLTQVPSLQPVWETLYNTPLVPFSRFYNTVMLGSVVLAILFFIPVYFGVKRFVVVYREKWKSKLDKIPLIKLIQGSKLAKIVSIFFQTPNPRI